MRVELPPMRAMDIDPTFVPYLEEAVAGRLVPLHEENVVERRARMAELRRRSAPPLPDDVRVETRAAAAAGRRLDVRLYRPAGGDGPRPCILYIHGGGWMYGSPEQSDVTCVRFCQHTGAVVASPRYRLAPEHSFPAAFEDCLAVLDWIAEGGAAPAVDAARIAVTGESSGGNLAAALALAARDRGGPAIRLQVLNYPALGTDFATTSYRENAAAPILSRDEMMYFWKAYLGDGLDSGDSRAVPLKAEDFSNLPPAHIVTAEYDPLRDDGSLYAEKLKAAGAPVVLHNAPRLPHGFMRAWSASADAGSLAEGMCRAFRIAFAVEPGERASA